MYVTDQLKGVLISEPVRLRAPFFVAAALGAYQWSFGWVLVLCQAFICFQIAPKRFRKIATSHDGADPLWLQSRTDPVEDDDDGALDSVSWPKCNHRAAELDPFELVMAQSDPSNQNEGLLRISNLSANHLAAQDWFSGKSDPYVTLYVADEHDTAISDKMQTDVKEATLNPEWNSIFSFDVQSKEGAFLVAEVWDFNKVKKSDFLGRVKIPLGDVVDGHHTFNLHGLLKSGAPATGHLFMTTEFLEEGDVESDQQRIKQDDGAERDEGSSSASPESIDGERPTGRADKLPGVFRWALRALEVWFVGSNPRALAFLLSCFLALAKRICHFRLQKVSSTALRSRHCSP